MKNIILSIIFVIFASSAFAGSCPMMAKNIDSKIEEAQKLRDAGMKAHKSGDHAKSEELLNHGVAIAPGIGFGDYNEFFRISACLDIKTLIEGMDIIKTRL